MVKSKGLTKKEAKEIVARVNRIYSLLKQNLSSCCEYPLVPGHWESDKNIKKGCLRYCSKCDKYCGWL